MKALRQIIDYLRRRGILTREQLIEYASEGVIRWDEVYEEAEADEPPPAEESARTVEEEEEDFDYLWPEERRRGPVQRKGPVLEKADLTRRLTERFGGWHEPLQGLWRVGRRINGCTTWAEAAVVLRNARPHDLAMAVARGLEEQDPPLNVLWEALALEAYCDIVEEPGLHGPAVAAYRAMLAVAEHAQLGRHTWLLKEQEVAAVYNLKQAQHCLLHACETAFRCWPELIATVIRHDYHWLAYWAFVLLHSARRSTPGVRLMPGNDEHRPPRTCPDEAGWLQAWAQAAVMAPRQVTAFLVEHTTLQDWRPSAIAAVLQRSVEGLAPRSRDILDRYYGRRLDQGQVAVQLGISEAEVAQDLLIFRRRLRGNLEGHPSLQAPYEEDEVRSWEAFLEDCLWWCFGEAGLQAKGTESEEFLRLIQQYFGPAADLVCPRSWD